MNQSFLFERQINTCSAPYQFYQCSAGGGFSGCCSIDPCNDGNCPAENQPGGSSSQTTASKTSSISQQQTATMISSHTTATSATSTSSSSLGQTTVPSSLSTASLSTSVGNTNVVTTATTILSTNTAASETATPSSNKGVLIGSCIGGVVGIILLFLLLFLWCRRRKASKTPNSNNNNNEKRRRTLFGFYGDSDYNTSNSWGQYSEDYYRKGQQHQISPDGQVDRTRSPALTELDASPRGSPLRAYPGTIYELDSTINEGSTATDASPRAPSSDPSSPNFRSPSTMSPASQHTQTRLGDHFWQSPESDTTMSNGSSPMGVGIRLAS